MQDAFPFRRLGLVGNGRVAGALALALRQPEAPPLVWSRSGHGLAGAVIAPDLAALAQGCDGIALAVSDDALPLVIAALAPLVRPGSFVFHLSGASGAGLLAPLAARGALVAAIHPAMTFTGNPPQEVARMAGAAFAITAPPAALAGARAVVARLGGVAVEVAEAERALYHAALCQGANHLVTLIASAMDMLRAAGVAAPGALLAPLAEAALANALGRGFDALTGPLRRGDEATLARHAAALAHGCPAEAEAYAAMVAATRARLARA